MCLDLGPEVVILTAELLKSAQLPLTILKIIEILVKMSKFVIPHILNYNTGAGIKHGVQFGRHAMGIQKVSM